MSDSTGSPDRSAPRIAIVGAGISGLMATRELDAPFEVELFEADARLGGHADTHDVKVDGRELSVDTGFIVYNEANYPGFTRLIEELGVGTAATDMSFSVSVEGGALEYNGGTLAGLFAQRRNLLRPRFWRLLADVMRFYRRAPGLAAEMDLASMTLGELLDRCGYSDELCRLHVLPMAAAIWSTPLQGVLDFPAATFIEFFDNHGLFELGDRPRWRTVRGGSRHYVEALAKKLRARVYRSTPIRHLGGSPGRWQLATASRSFGPYDHVILACHGDQAADILSATDVAHRGPLADIRYTDNRALLHRDAGFMPRRPRAWAAWNYLGRGRGDEHLLLTYWMSRLQALPARDLFVTLNPHREPEHILAERTYQHPLYTARTIAAQRALGELQGRDRIWLCGAYLGYGFHEDGVQSALKVAAALRRGARQAESSAA